jgi:uncharacterized protein (TIGR02265 family)
MSQQPPRLFPVVRVDRPVIPDADKRLLYPTADLLVAPAQRMTPAIQAVLRAEFGAVLDAPTHSAQVANQLINRLAVLCYPDLAPAAAQREQGRVGLTAWRRTPLGWLITAALPLLGPAQIMRRVPHLIAGLTNFGSRWLIRESPQHWWYCTSDDPTLPDFCAGILDGLADFTMVPNLVVTATAPSSHERLYEIRW